MSDEYYGFDDIDFNDDDGDQIDDEFDDDECGMMGDGGCSLAGTEFCDWDCPYSDEL